MTAFTPLVATPRHSRFSFFAFELPLTSYWQSFAGFSGFLAQPRCAFSRRLFRAPAGFRFSVFCRHTFRHDDGFSAITYYAE